MATQDILVKRTTGAATTPATIAPSIKLAIIGRSRGQAAEDSGNIASHAVRDLFSLKTDIVSELIDYCRSVESIQDYVAGDSVVEDTYYPDIHFRVKHLEGVAPAADDYICDPDNILDENGSDIMQQDLYADWTNSPSLQPPMITKAEIIDVPTVSGGFAVAGTYYYSITVIDKNSRETSIGPIKRVIIPAPAVGRRKHVKLTWSQIRYASGYRVYRGTLEDGSDMGLLATISSASTVTYTDINAASGADPPASNTTRIEPNLTSKITIHFHYANMTYNTPVEYTKWSDVQDAHGVGSELANMAKLCMSSEFNACPNMITVVPEGSSASAYYTALETLKNVGESSILLIGVLYLGSENITTLNTIQSPIYAHAANQSDPTTHQHYRYVFLSVPNDTPSKNDVDTMCNGFQATATKGKRGFLVTPSGLKCTINQWQKPDGTYLESTTRTDPAGIDMTSLMHSIASAARYIGLNDPAMPLTEKDVLGFGYPNPAFTFEDIADIRSYGSLLIENRSGIGVVSQSINMSHPVLGMEDGEMNICVTEDYMKIDIKRRLKQLRGLKMLGPIIKQAERITGSALAYYVKMEYIADYSDVASWQDDVEKDKLRVFFKYMPIYPVNKIWVIFDYTFTVL